MTLPTKGSLTDASLRSRRAQFHARVRGDLIRGELHFADRLALADADHRDAAAVERTVGVAAQHGSRPALADALIATRCDRDEHVAALHLVANHAARDRRRFLETLRVLHIGIRLVTRREVLRDVLHALLRAARRRIRTDLVPARLVRRIRRLGALAFARGPVGRRARRGTYRAACRVLRIERELVARRFGLGDAGELRRIGNLDLRQVRDDLARLAFELDGELVLAGVAALGREHADEVFALRVCDRRGALARLAAALGSLRNDDRRSPFVEHVERQLQTGARWRPLQREV